MPIIRLRFKANELAAFRLEKGKSLTIGREESNDIPIENRAVSKYHARIESIGDGFLLSDLESKNGTYVHQQRIASQWLQHQDLIRVGHHTLVFEYAQDELQPATQAANASLYPLPPLPIEPGMEVAAMAEDIDSRNAGAAAATLRYLSGGAGTVFLGKHPITLGRGNDCDIAVGGLTIGKLAAVIRREATGYLLSYSGGLTKPKINDRTISSEARLNNLDVIALGSVKLQFLSSD